MPITLSIADNADGTGAVASIAGSAVGSSNLVKVAPWANGGLTFSGFGPRVGDGSQPLALSNGYYLAYVENTAAGALSLSNFRTFQATGGVVYQSAHKALAESVAATIRGMIGTSIVGLASASVRVRKTAYLLDFTSQNPLPNNYSYQYPAIIVCYFDREQENADKGTNDRDEMIYPLTIVFAQETQSAATPSESNDDQFLRWREAVERTFTHLRGTGPITVASSGVSTTFFNATLLGGMIVDPEGSMQKKIDVGWMKFGFITWRGKLGTT